MPFTEVQNYTHLFYVGEREKSKARFLAEQVNWFPSELVPMVSAVKQII